MWRAGVGRSRGAALGSEQMGLERCGEELRAIVKAGSFPHDQQQTRRTNDAVRSCDAERDGQGRDRPVLAAASWADPTDRVRVKAADTKDTDCVRFRLREVGQ